MSASLPELMDKIVIDGTKVGWYPDRIAAWQRGERIAPITIDCAMTRACNAACIGPDEPIAMADGTYMRMADIRAGDKVLSFANGEILESIVSAAWLSKVQADIISIVTEGSTLRCTRDHRILTNNGWREAGELRIGDEIITFKETVAASNGTWKVMEGKETREGQDGVVNSRDLLAQGRREGKAGNDGLPGGRLECTCIVDEGNCRLDDEQHRAMGRAVVSRVLGIHRAGTSPVYDMECFPHHNFIASGVVVHNCNFCYAQLQASDGEKMTQKAFFDFLDDAAEIGVQGVSFISDGESTVVPWYADAVEHAANLGLQVGAGSNGIKLTKDILERVLPHLSYLRFNFSAGERKRYAEIMGVPQHCYDDVIQNIKDGMEIINRDGLGCTLNMQLVCDPKDADQLIPFAELACKLRPTYAVIKHCADDVEHHLGVDYSKYDSLTPTFDRIEQMGNDAGVKITVKRSRMDGKRTYDRCYGPPFIMQLSGNGLVAPCGFLFNEKYKAFHIGNIVNERFRDVFYSDRYLEVMKYLASEHFDPRKRCGPNCLQHNTNDFLYRYVNGKVSLPTTEKPSHMGFI